MYQTVKYILPLLSTAILFVGICIHSYTQSSCYTTWDSCNALHGQVHAAVESCSNLSVKRRGAQYQQCAKPPQYTVQSATKLYGVQQLLCKTLLGIQTLRMDLNS